MLIAPLSPDLSAPATSGAGRASIRLALATERSAVMPIAVSCPSCGGTIRAPENLAGRKVKCPKCAAHLMLPAAEAGAEGIQATAPVAVPQPPAAAPPPPLRQSVRAERDDPGRDDRDRGDRERGDRDDRDRDDRRRDRDARD